MFAYCDNNPVNYIDPYGESGFAAALAGWTSSAWWLTLADGPLPVGDIIYAAGCVVLGVACVVETAILIDTTIDTINTIVSMVQENTDTTPKNSNDTPKEGKKPEHNLPTQGEPNSDQELHDADGLKQKRHYGPDGKAEYDIDYRHPDPQNNHEFPHRHNWDWSKTPPRSKWIKIFEDIHP